MDFQVGKVYLTADKARLRCICIDRQSVDGHPIVFLDERNGRVLMYRWDGTGQYCGSSRDYITCLAPQIATTERWVVLYHDPYHNETCMCMYTSLGGAEMGQVDLRRRGYDTTDVLPLRLEGEIRKCKT